MTKVLIDGRWYEQLASTALYESEFEDIVMSQAARLYPSYHLIRFKKMVYSEEEGRKPDFALIDRKYRDWWVVEAELSHHNLENHVLPQVRTFSQAYYGPEEAEYLCAQMPTLEKHAVLDMMKGNQPRVLVVVNGECPGWAEALDSLDAHITVFEVFRSKHNRHLFMVDGEGLSQPDDFVSLCWLDPSIPRLLRVAAPAAIDVPPNTLVKIWYNGGITEWSRMDAQDMVWLNPVSNNPLSMKVTYELVKLEDGSLEILRHPTKAKRKG
jgi:hypothetical protein